MTILLQRVRLKWVCGIEVEQIRRKCNRAQRAPAFDSAEVRFAQDDSLFIWRSTQDEPQGEVH
jgi:hypothetical protein